MLLNMIKEDLVFSNNSTVSQLPVEKQLAITLFWFGHNRNAASVEAIAQWAGVCCSTIVNSTVAQKTVQMFACFGKIALVQNANIIQGPNFFITKNTTTQLLNLMDKMEHEENPKKDFH